MAERRTLGARARPPLLLAVWALTLADLLAGPAWAAPAAVVGLVAYLAASVREARREFFTGDFPCSTLYAVSQLVDTRYLVEIDADAILGAGVD